MLLGVLPLDMSSCDLVSTSRAIRKDMRVWVLSREGSRWTVKFDVRNFGVILTLPSVAGLPLWLLGCGWLFRGWFIFALPLGFHGWVSVIRSMFILGALQVYEASLLASSSLRKLRSSILKVIWSRRQSLACVGAVLSLMDGPQGCDPACCVVWFRFSMFRRFLALRSSEVGQV